METLGLSGSAPRSDGRLKSLFWPSIQSATDVDYLGTQGYWVCTLIAVLSLVVLVATGQTLAGLCVSGVSVLRILFAALLLSNLRATWIAAQWKPESDQAASAPRLSETLGDKLADQLPPWLWPKVRIVYYIFSAGYLLLVAVGLWAMSHRVVH